MPKRPDDYMADRRDRILEAVEKCLRDKGWNQTSLRDVADAAGLSKGGLYVHFPTKTALLKEILRRNLEEIRKIGDAEDMDAFVTQTLGKLDYVTGSGGREGAISHIELQLDGLRNPELKPLVEELVREAATVLEDVVRRFCPNLDAQAARDRALTLLFFLEGLRNYTAVADAISLAELRRVTARELRILLDRGGE